MALRRTPTAAELAAARQKAPGTPQETLHAWLTVRWGGGGGGDLRRGMVLRRGVM